MKIVKALLVGIFVLSIVNSASALNFDVKNIKGFANLDVFTAGTADNRTDKQFKAVVGHPESDCPGSYGLDTSGAVGGRIGALYPIADVADVGLSLGYIGGPTTEIKIDNLDYQTVERRFFRVLAEGRKTFKYNDKISFLGGAGLGIAYGRQEGTYETAFAPVINGVIVDTTRKYFRGFTWELSAGATYKATDKLDVEAGVRYAGFPSCSNTIDDDGNQWISGMNYNALGFFAGVSF